MFPRSWSAIAAVGLFCFLVGCRQNAQPPTPPADPQQAYANAYLAVMEEYQGKMMELTSRSLPPRSPGMSAKEFRAKIASQVDEVAKATTACDAQMAALTPPPSLREFHESWRHFFQVSADGNHSWAEAIRTGSRQKASHAAKAKSQAELAAMKKVFKTAETAGIDVTPFRSKLAEMEAEVKEM